MARNLLGKIPDDHFENDPIYPPPKSSTTQLSKELLKWIEKLNHGSDKYRPGDIGY
jgi:hypothetical protein